MSSVVFRFYAPDASHEDRTRIDQLSRDVERCAMINFSVDTEWIASHPFAFRIETPEILALLQEIRLFLLLPLSFFAGGRRRIVAVRLNLTRRKCK